MKRKIRLDRRLVLEDPMRSPDGAGGYTQNWTPLGQIWARVTPQSGREDGDRSLMRYRIAVRRMPEGAPSRPRPDQRFRDGTRLYHIEAVTESADDPQHLLCLAYEEVAA